MALWDIGERREKPTPDPSLKGGEEVARGKRLKAGKQKSHPNGWLFWYCKDFKDLKGFKVVKVVKDYSSLSQLVCNIRRYER